MNMKSYNIDQNGYYGEFGGSFIPEILHKAIESLREQYLTILESEEFQKEFHELLRDYVGRPSPLYLAKRLSEKYGCKIYLKREDLNHTGAHKINNAIGQILLARKMGKKRIIAETGAGQHGVATATACALMNMPCRVYMGAIDIERQHVNVEKMRMLGAEVFSVTSGSQTLTDAVNEALRDWCTNPEDTFYLLGSAVGPHPYPDLVARLQSVISKEIKEQLMEFHFCRNRRYHSRFPHSGSSGRERTDQGTLFHLCRSGLSGNRPSARSFGKRKKSTGNGHQRRRGAACRF